MVATKRYTELLIIPHKHARAGMLSGLVSNYLYVGLAHSAPPTNTNFQDNVSTNMTSDGLSMTNHLYICSVIFEVYHHFTGFSFIAGVSFW